MKDDCGYKNTTYLCGVKNNKKIHNMKLANYELEENDGGFYYGGYLDLEGTGITSLPENLTVGGSLDLEGTGITSLPENLTVGGSLYLEGTGITSLPENLTVGGSLYLEGTVITSPKYKKIDTDNHMFSWQNEKYIKCDGMFLQVLQHKKNVYKAKRIRSSDIIYVVTDGNGKFSHGESIKSAKEDLIFKISNRDKSEYEKLTLDSILTFEKAIECYRIVTGACSFGTKDFVYNRLGEKKSEYSISEIIELTKNEYGGKSFADFFNTKEHENF